MKHIADHVSGRDNNFNLIRFLAASAVVLAHSFVIVTGQRSADPLYFVTGHGLGYHAVNVFFAASGFLIAQSWLRTPSLFSFMAARFLRLWPALVICTLLLVFVFGPLLSILPPADYFTSRGIIAFIPQVLSLLRTDIPLPGVNTPVPGDLGINAPLWTLKYEVICYISLATLGMLGLLTASRRFTIAISLIMGMLMLASLFPFAHDPTHPWVHLVRFGLCFGFGVIARIGASHIPLTLWGVAASFALAVLLHGTLLYEVGTCLFTAYATIWLALVPPPLRHLNRLGDYSYGIYIFAYPMQLLLMRHLPRLSPLELFAWAMPATMLLSVISWHWIEKPCLQMRAQTAQFFDAILGGFGAMLGWRPRQKADLPDRAEA